MRKILPVILPLVTLAASGFAQTSGQLSPTAAWATHAANEYQVYPNVTYLTMGDTQLKMDIYRRRTATTPQPTLIYMHGGFWVAGNKEGAILSLLPWMEMGWNVINVEYRLGPNTLAPGALEDCFCALRYVAQQAMMYNVDVGRIVVTGESAGGHLALSLGILPESEGFDRECAAAQGGSGDQLVWNQRCARRDRRSPSCPRSGALVRQHAEPDGNRQAGFAVDLRPYGPAADLDHPW
jgi:acetyl esterase/lipase